MDDLRIEKVDEFTIQVTRTKAADVLAPVRYDYAFLKAQLQSIQDRKDRDNSARDAEIAEVLLLLTEADKLGVTTAKAEETPI